jgi:hypothetical protein
LKKGTEEEHRNQGLFELEEEERDRGKEWRIERCAVSSMKPVVSMEG